MRGIVLWEPMLSDDDVGLAVHQADSWADDRVEHWWDGDKEMSRLFESVLGLQGPAWDVYLLYPRGIRWDGQQPPSPCFWMHQLSDEGANRRLLLARDPGRLSRELDALVQK